MIDSLNWRYATKKFDKNKQVSAENIQLLKEAVRLTASSYGLQPYKVLEIKNPEIREQLKTASFGQPQVTDASTLFVFCANDDLTDAHIDAYLELSAKTQQIDVAGLKGYGDFMKGVFGSRTTAQKHEWSARQVYIALGNLLTTAASMQIDVSPMEGFDPKQYDEILGMKGSGYSTVVIAAIGYRSSDDEAQYKAKVRKPMDELFETVSRATQD
ncbi:putative NAD(P)H nitroreductase [bioreactor metagenome]|jgi:nitroreductase|uniref:Putative NAD(P)H nitroreductase n=1 Tax=bioreactor metagenome TaxID=1076179 RepID=A0A644VC29_9ZZZZ|nr:NAD(P)H-dependent oxidoreductase [Paludibacter sp.]